MSFKSLLKPVVPQPVLKWYSVHRPGRRRRDEHKLHEINDRAEFLRRAFIALQYNGISGDYAEFGCCSAKTFTLAYRTLTTYPYPLGSVHLWAFDSFQGLPEHSDPKDEHPKWNPGTMAISLDQFHEACRRGGLPRKVYTVVPGFYENTLRPDAAGPLPNDLRLVYIDCDMYSSTKQVLEFLQPRLKHGMILAFDDYYCYTSTKPSGERLALEEFVSRNQRWQLVPYVQFGWHGLSFIVENTQDLIPG